MSEEPLRVICTVLLLGGIAFVAWTYLGYPLLLFLFGFWRRRPEHRLREKPKISVLVAAYNEEASIGQRMLNALDTDYPRECLELAVVSDRSTDCTEEIVRGFANWGVKLIVAPRRLGKTGAQNLAVPHLGGEILVFTDATTSFTRSTLSELAAAFADPGVGGVEGRLIYRRAATGHLGAKDWLKSYEALVKTLECRISSGVGDNGACYALRRSLWRSLPGDMTSDLAAPLDVLRQGARFAFAPRALSSETASETWTQEFKRKVRTARAGVYVVARSRDLLHPFRYPAAALVLYGRKISRWVSAFVVPALLLLNLALVPHPVFGPLLALQGCMWGLAVTGAVFPRLADRTIVLSGPRAFIAVHLAALVGALLALFAGNSERWTPHRRGPAIERRA